MNSKEHIDIESIDYAYSNEIIYLEPTYSDEGKKTIVGSNKHTSRELREILDKINLLPFKAKPSIKVYCEDRRAKDLMTCVMKKGNIDIEQYAEFVPINLSYSIYVTLHQHNVPEFTENLVVLDHDVQTLPAAAKHLDYLEKAANILFLPLDVEKGLFPFLREHATFNEFSRRILQNNKVNFDYDTCFNHWPENEYSDVNEYKHWLAQVETVVGDLEILYELWCEKNMGDVVNFVQCFRNAYNVLAEKSSLDLI